MPTTTAHVIAFFTALEERRATPTDPAKTVALEDAINNILADGVLAAKTHAGAAITSAITTERASIVTLLATETEAIRKDIEKERRRAAIGFGLAFAASMLIVTVYHFTVGPGAIAARTTALETETASLEQRIDVTQSGISDAEVNITDLQEKLDEQRDFMKAIWPDHDRDGDNVVDRVDICRDTPRGQEVLEGSVDGCSIEQAAWFCTDLPAIPATDLTFTWPMTHCPAGMLDPGERVTCTFNVKPDRSGLATNNNCQIH